jgi:hypothetical protein
LWVLANKLSFCGLPKSETEGRPLPDSCYMQFVMDKLLGREGAPWINAESGLQLPGNVRNFTYCVAGYDVACLTL